MPNLIGSVKVTPPNPAPGESVQVQVLDPNGTPYAADPNVTIALDGVPVASRYYQFPTAGTRTIAVYARGRGMTEATTVTVNVTGTPLTYRRTLAAPEQPAAPTVMPFLTLTQNLANPYQVTFSLASPPAAGAAAARALADANKANAASRPLPAAGIAQKPPPGLSALQTLLSGESTVSTISHLQHVVVKEPVTLPPPSTSYVWTFGDGQTATTNSPSVVHDYFPAITPGRVPFAFDVQCRITHDNVTVTRTFVLYSAYGMCQRNGVIVPHSVGDVFATLNSDRTSFSATLIVHNIEATAITIDQMAIVPVWNDPAATFPAFAFKKMAQPVTIAGRSSSLLAVRVLRSDLSAAAKGAAVTGFIVAFQGTLAAPPPVEPRPLREAAMLARPIARPTADLALGNRLRPSNVVSSTVAASTVRLSRHVRLRLQDQQLPGPPAVTFHPGQVVLDNLGKAPAIRGAAVRSGSLSIDPATNVVSVGLTTRAPAAAQAAQVRHSVLSVLNMANLSGGS